MAMSDRQREEGMFPFPSSPRNRGTRKSGKKLDSQYRLDDLGMTPSGKKVCSPFRHPLEIGEPENRAKNWIPNIARAIWE